MNTEQDLTSSPHGSNTHVMRCDVIQQLKILGCGNLVLGKYKAVVGQFGFIINWQNADGSKGEKRWKEDEEINITEIVDDNWFLSGDLTPAFKAHKDFFKGIVRHSA